MTKWEARAPSGSYANRKKRDGDYILETWPSGSLWVWKVFIGPVQIAQGTAGNELGGRAAAERSMAKTSKERTALLPNPEE